MTTCKTEGCGAPTSGRSKYCRTHAREARAAWRALVAAGAAERDARYARFSDALADARKAGAEAGEAVVPTPMLVSDPSTGRIYPPVMDGVCGFAWVSVRPATCSFARWLVKHGHARVDRYAGGAQIWVSAFNQSYTRKMACAEAMAEALRASLGVRAMADGRLD